MRLRNLILMLGLPLVAACSDMPERRSEIAATAGGLIAAQRLDLLTADNLALGLVTFAIYDPLSPTWSIEARRMGQDRVQLSMVMKHLITGGEGEARQVFLRNARRLVEEGGYAGFDVVRYEEGIEATRPFARRVADGEIRLVKSRQFPEL